MLTKKYKVIIFDFDGVLVDSVHIKGKAFAKIYERFGDSASSYVMDYHMAHGGISRYDKFKHFHQHILNNKINGADLEELCSQFSGVVRDLVCDADYIAGAKSFLERNYTFFQCYVASATPENELMSIISARNMSHFFKSCYGSPKNKKYIITEIIQQSGCNIEDIVMIGDAESDYLAARDNTVDFIGVGENWDDYSHKVAAIKDLRSLENVVFNELVDV